MRILLIFLLIGCASDFKKAKVIQEQTEKDTGSIIDLSIYKEKSKKNNVIKITTASPNVEDESEEELISLLNQIQSEEEKNFFDLGKKAPPPAKFFMLPFNGRISSGYGIRKGKMHHGIDLPGKIGSPIKASNHGKVVYSGAKGGYGNVVILSHFPNLFSVYAHNSKNLVRVGNIIKKGEIIAQLGNTGKSSGPHLHFEIRKGTTSLDPIKFIKEQNK